MPSQASLPTPTSADEHDALRGQKRRRVQSKNTAGSPNAEDSEGEDKFIRYFDPNQDADERRDIKRKSRALERAFNGE